MSERAMRQSATMAAVPVSGTRTGLVLSIMMFLQYAIWGLWLPILSIYLGTPIPAGGLGFSGTQIGWILGLAGSIGAVTAPFIAGQVADRYMNAERALALLLLVGGVLQFFLAGTTSYGNFLLVSILYSVVYMPTLSLTNSISFHNLDDKEKKFPFIRSFGTIGWVVASGVFGSIWLSTPDKILRVQRIADALRLAGGLSIVYAVYCLLLLPKTPPRKDVENPLAFMKAFSLLRHRGFLVVTLIALPIAMIHQCYFFRSSPYLKQDIRIPEQWIGWVMGIGQASEIVFLALLGLFLKRLGYRIVLAMGGLAYALRFSIFAIGDPHGMVIAAQALHGLCYGCFFAGAFLYVEKVSPADIRHSAQTVFGIIILGIGPVLAGFYNQYFDRFKKVMTVDGVATTVQQYSQFWWAEAGIALLATLVLLALFPRKESE